MPKPPSRRTGRVVVIGLVLAIVLSELFFTFAGPFLAGQLGLDTRRVSAVLEDQSRRIRAMRADDGSLLLLDPELGWRFRPAYDSGKHQLNAAGLRSEGDHDLQRKPGVRRVAVFGDAYAYAAEVENREAWPTLMEAADSTLELLNHGVGGFGTDQALLYFLRDGMRYAPDVVLIGFSPVSLRRAVNVYPRFIATSEAPPAKPRFRLDAEGALELLPNPLATNTDWDRLLEEPRRVIELGVHDQWYEPWRYENPLHDLSATMRFGVALGTKVWRKCCWSERIAAGGSFREEASAFAVQRAVLLAFADSVRARGASPVIVMLPDLETVQGVREGRPAMYSSLHDSLVAAARAPVVDLLDAFAAAPTDVAPRSWFAPGGHYSATGNTVVARWLAARLDSLGEAP